MPNTYKPFGARTVRVRSNRLNDRVAIGMRCIAALISTGVPMSRFASCRFIGQFKIVSLAAFRSTSVP
ncbi:hypothetical protein C8039_12060 [Halogeometricum sp. wsp3]|nr:hypothetical protein C8039_12060 [Halogeometricum sp. wsp3]